jgi:hypothetical protein
MLSDYQTLAQRRDHCDLQQPCHLRGNNRRTRIRRLLKYLRLDKTNIIGMHCLHLCDNDTHNGGCSNPQHLYQEYTQFSKR